METERKLKPQPQNTSSKYAFNKHNKLCLWIRNPEKQGRTPHKLPAKHYWVAMLVQLVQHELYVLSFFFHFPHILSHFPLNSSVNFLFEFLQMGSSEDCVCMHHPLMDSVGRCAGAFIKPYFTSPPSLLGIDDCRSIYQKRISAVPDISVIRICLARWSQSFKHLVQVSLFLLKDQICVECVESLFYRDSQREDMSNIACWGIMLVMTLANRTWSFDMSHFCSSDTVIMENKWLSWLGILRTRWQMGMENGSHLCSFFLILHPPTRLYIVCRLTRSYSFIIGWWTHEWFAIWPTEIYFHTYS